MKKLIAVASTVLFLAGCSSQASRMADCEAQGISRDTCYLSEQNRQSAINSAAEKQALENAQAQYPQKAQAAKKDTSFVKHYNGMAIKRDKSGIVTVDGKPAAQDEVTADATTYLQGIYTFIVYKTGKVAVMKDGSFQGYAK
ncbi:hypothetical protein F3R65_15710 [Salmonella enterica subsp. enterica]|nr:hypothetical protein [Salmonella enterica]EBV2387092.1 hypothetical protein [Salmonella enterica subsp. enterica serovar Mississippi]ECW0843328.1 hypothetical protein [Salmonella enterica subsp. enterica]EDD9543310.1 hypothetical protein [Salmonella enterica subsp. enterica serovar Rissen]EAY3694880.1 hypothetical protein [Salmonella enterica]